MEILLLADIHGNYPALKAIVKYFEKRQFDHIINCGDSIVYAPFPNEVLNWLKSNEVLTILGNTDKKVIKLLKGKSFKKPSKHEKRVMYETTAEVLSEENIEFLLSCKKKNSLLIEFTNPGESAAPLLIGVFHGSPDHPHEFIFASTPDERFFELAQKHPYQIIVSGHSHSPYHKQFGKTHFINPGSVGRMFDGNPSAGCAVLTFTHQNITVTHFRIKYEVQEVVKQLRKQNLPSIYERMYVTGRKLN